MDESWGQGIKRLQIKHPATNGTRVRTDNQFKTATLHKKLSRAANKYTCAHTL
jgi:hypothetical protein